SGSQVSSGRGGRAATTRVTRSKSAEERVRPCVIAYGRTSDSSGGSPSSQARVIATPTLSPAFPSRLAMPEERIGGGDRGVVQRGAGDGGQALADPLDEQVHLEGDEAAVAGGGRDDGEARPVPGGGDEEES